MNMRMSVTYQLAPCICDTSIELNPAVRGITDIVNPARMRPAGSMGPSVAGFDHSSAVRATAPATRRTIVPVTTVTVLSVQRRGKRIRRRSSMITGNPRPPRMIAAQMGRQIQGSVANEMRLSLKRAKPALLKLEIEWKTPSQTASPGVWP